MKKSKRIKLIVAALCGLLSLSSCGFTIDGKMDQWGIIRPEFFGALFNQNPDNFNLSFLNEAYETATNPTYSIDETKSNYTTRDILEDTVIINRSRYINNGSIVSPYLDTRSEQLFSFVYEYGKEDWCKEIKKSEHYDFDYNPNIHYTSSHILNSDYVKKLKSDPHVNYMFKIKSTDKNIDGRYYAIYIASGVNGIFDYYTDEGKEYLYKKIEVEQKKIKDLWDNSDAKKKEELFNSSKGIFPYDIIGVDDCDLTKKKYAYLEMEEVNKPAVELKLPYFYDLFGTNAGNFNKSEIRALRYDTISTDDFMSGNYLPIDSCLSGAVEKYSPSDSSCDIKIFCPGETLQVILKEDILLEGMCFDDYIDSYHLKFTCEDVSNGMEVLIGKFYDFQTDLLKAYNASFYDNFYTNWVSNYNKSLYVDYSFDYINALVNGGYKEYINENYELVTAYSHTKDDSGDYLVLKKGTPIVINPSGCHADSTIINFNLKFKVLKDLKY